MRVLYITPNYLPAIGGLEILTSQLLQELRSRGHQVALLTSSQPGVPAAIETVDGVQIMRSDLERAIGTRDVAGTARAHADTRAFVNEFSAEVVHGHDAGPMLWLHQRMTRSHPRPLVVTLHTVASRHLPGPLMAFARLLAEAAWVTGVSHTVAHDLVAIEPTVADRLSVVPTGIAAPPAVFAGAPARPARFLCLGRLVASKRVDRAIEAVALARTLDGVDLFLDIVGDGPERHRLRARAVELGVADLVALAGAESRDDVWRRLASATAVVMPSAYEGLPLVALEAAAMSRPVIGSRAPSLAEVVVDDVTGILVDGEQPAAIAAAMSRLAGDAALVAKMGACARDGFRKDRSLAGCTDGYLEIYERVRRPRSLARR